MFYLNKIMKEESIKHLIYCLNCHAMTSHICGKCLHSNFISHERSIEKAIEILEESRNQINGESKKFKMIKGKKVRPEFNYCRIKGCHNFGVCKGKSKDGTTKYRKLCKKHRQRNTLSNNIGTFNPQLKINEE